MSQPREPDQGLWPTPDYDHQIARLRAALGCSVYLVELDLTQTHLGIRQLGQAFVLLDLIDFPRPDPARGLAPHLILLDDGRGVNLGHIARISRDRPFNPSPSQVIYQDAGALQGLLFRERRLSKDQIAGRSREVLGRIIGRGADPLTTNLPAAGRLER